MALLIVKHFFTSKKWNNLCLFSLFYDGFDLLKALLAEEWLPFPIKLTPRNNKQLAYHYVFHTQINQSQVNTPNQLLYLTLIHQASISPALNQPRARYQNTEDRFSAPKPTGVIPTSHLLVLCHLPCFSLENPGNGRGPCFPPATALASWPALMGLPSCGSAWCAMMLMSRQL